MKIQKYLEYLILEGDTPEDYMKACLTEIKSRLDKMFITSDIQKIEEFDKYNFTLLNTPEISQYSPLGRELKYKFADEDNQVYILTINIYLKDALNDDKETDYNVSDIKKAVIRFDKYNAEEDMELVGQILSRTVEPDEINEDFLINLKSEIDGESEPPENKEEEFKIELDENDREEPSEEI